MTARTRTAILALLSLIVVGGLAFGIWQMAFDGSDEDGGPSPAVEEEGPVTVVESAAFPGGGPGDNARLRIRLSSGQPQPDGAQGAPVAEGTPLSEAEIQQVLNRLPTVTPDATDVQDFRLPEESLPPPRTGETVDEPFPPETGAGAAAETSPGPLEVLRFSPEGNVPLVPFLSVTFNQPMVPVATVEELAAADVPVTLTPSVSGVWEWVGTKTLTFEARGGDADRLPMATEFVAEVPAGTESATGGVLAESISWRFQTPPPQVETAYPKDGPQPLEPLLFVAFDQIIDPAAVLETVDVTAGGESHPLRLATAEEVAEDEVVSRLAEQAEDGRWLAFRAGRPFSADTDVVVSVGPGTPSAEGPLVTEQEQSFRFHTYPPLEIVRHRCGWSNDCPPFAPFIIEFSSPLDEALFDQSLIEIDPPLPGASVRLSGATITIQGATEGRTDYEVTVDGAVGDVFGQTLGQEQTVTFEVGSARRRLTGPEPNLITVDPAAGSPRFTVYSVNYERLRVRAYAVEPADWPDFSRYLQRFREQELTLPGRQVMDETINVNGARDALTETAIDLSDAVEGPYGHLIVVVEPPADLVPQDDDRRRPVVQKWVQVTNIALDAFADQDEMIVWVTDLRDGAPLADVTIRLGSAQATTGGDGTARLVLPAGGAGLLVGQKGDDSAILTNNPYYYDERGWSTRPVRDELRWYMFDDRRIYRPGEEVHLKGWLRRVGGGPEGGVSLAGDAVTSVRYQVDGPQGNELLGGDAEVNALGGFDLTFTLPENANLGHAGVRFSARGDLGALGAVQEFHPFQIQEFRRPEFEVQARQETSGPYFVGESATVAVKAAYYAGGPLPNAPVEWTVRSSPASYTPPNWPDFVFGEWTPWWFSPVYEDAFYGGPEPFYGPGVDVSPTEIFTGFTDAAGEHYLELSFEEADKPQPFSVSAEAAVIDVNRQAWAGSANLLVHPADLYVGLRSERTFVQRGQPLDIEAIVTDLDGNAIPGRTVEVRAARTEWRYNQGEWAEEEVDAQTCTVQSAAEPVACTFTTEEGGSYRIVATVTDDQGRVNQSAFTRWVSGGRRPTSRRVEQESLTLIPDRENYEPGDVAEILVQAPFSPAEGLLTVSRSGVLYTESFRLTEGSHTLRVPIEEAHLPNLHVQVDLAGAAPRLDGAGEPVPDAPPRPAYATGRLNLPISTRSRTLSVDVAPQVSGLEPGGETVIDVAVTDAGGRPVAEAEVAVVVVDEAILALTNYQLADPVEIFYRFRESAVQSTYGRATVTLARPETLVETAGEAVEVTRVVTEAEMPMEEPAAEEAAMAMDTMGADDGRAAQEQAIRVRTDFNPLAVFAPAVRTDGDGRAQVDVSLPDNLTRYRVMAVAVTEQEFGQGESNLTARLPLMVRPSAPRFLNFGDRFELPVVVQNQTGQEMTVDVVVRASNVELTDGAGRRVVVPADDRVEVRFPATTGQPGTARFQVAAVSGAVADAATVELPVYTPATTEAFATYGVVDEGAIAQPVAAPDGVIPQFGGLEIQTSSTALQALTDAVLYLVDYRYACSEQLASRILAVAALRDVLSAFEAEGLPAPAEIEAAVREDVERLVSMQNGDGGFPVWVRGRQSIPFYTIHVAHALQRARLKGFAVPEETLQRALVYLREIEGHYPPWYGERTRNSLSAYALYVRHVMGNGDPEKAAQLLDEVGLTELPLEAVAWLWPVLGEDGGYAEEVDAIRRHINNRAVETAGAANFTTSYGDQTYLMLHSDRRADAVILDALIAEAPESDLIPKVVNGLLAHRTRGRWSNTQENVFVLLALDRYFNTFESQTPEFVARIWLGETYAGGHTYSGRSTERHATQIPMSYLMDAGQGAQELILSKEGTGRLYYRLGLRYAPADLDLDPLDRGFVVERTYEAVDDPDDVYRDEDGVWHVRAGSRVRVRLKMVAENRRYHVALVDSLPAGLEIVNPALAVAQDAPPDPDARPSGWWWYRWYEHQNMRDERAEAFTTLLWDGVYEYTYVARATTPGEFVVPPTKAEEMYSPEVFGRSGSDRLVVE